MVIYMEFADGIAVRRRRKSYHHGITLAVLISNAVTVSLESDEKTCLKRSNKLFKEVNNTVKVQDDMEVSISKAYFGDVCAQAFFVST